MLLSAAGHGDTAFQLRRIRQRRQQLEAAEGFPASGAGIKLQQERLAANAAAASARNKALQQSLAEAADAQLATGHSMDPQLLALAGAYLNLVRAAFPAWAAQAGPSLQEHQLQQSCTISSWYAGPASHLPCSQHSTPAGAGKQSFRFNIPQPAKSFSQQQHPQQQQQRQHQPMQYALSPQRCAGTGGQDAAGTRLQGQQSGTAGAEAEAGTSGQAPGCTQPQQQQQQQSCASSDPFMASLQDITTQLALLQQALSSHQQLQQQQQQQLSRSTEPHAAAAGPSFSLRSGQPLQQGAAAAAAAAAAGSVAPASSNGSCNGSPVAATSANPASAPAAADVTTTPKTQRLIQARLEQQQQQRNSQSADGAAPAAAAAAQHSTAGADGGAQGAPEQAAGALRQPSDVEHETVTYTKGRFKVQESPPSRPVSRTPSMPNSHAPTPCPDSPGADDPPAGRSEPQAQQQGQQQQQQQAEGAAAGDGEGGAAVLQSAGGSGGDTRASASAAGAPCAGHLDAMSAAIAADRAGSMPTVAEEEQDAAEHQQQQQQQQQRSNASAVCMASFSQAVQSRAEVLQVDAVAVVRCPSTAAGTSSSTKGTARPAIKSPPPPPPLPQQRQQQKLSTPAARGGVGGRQQQQGREAGSEASAAQPTGRSTHSMPQQAESRKQEQQQVPVVSPCPSFGTPQEQAGCIHGSPSRRTSLAAGAPAAAPAAAAPAGGGGSSAVAGSLSPTASLHLHQQLVFSPLQLGSVSWKAADSSSVAASPDVTAKAGTAGATAAVYTQADATASPGSRAVAAEVLLPGALQMARALSGEAQQLVFSPLRLSSTSLPAPALSPTVGTAAVTKQVHSGASQQEEEEEGQGRLSQQGSEASSGSGVVRQDGSAAVVVAGQEDGLSTRQHQQEEDSMAVQRQVNFTEVAGTAAGEQLFTPTAPPAAQPVEQEPAGPSMHLWEQAVFSPLKSATGTAAAAAGSPSTLASPTQPGQLATEGLVVSTDRQEVVFSPLRLGAAGGGGSVSRGSLGLSTPSPPGSAVQQQQRHGSPQRQQQQQPGASSGNGSSSSVPVGAAFLGSLSPVRTPAGASGAGSAQRPNSQLVLLSGSAVTQQQQQQRLGISSLAVGLGPGRSPAGAVMHSTPQQDSGSRVLRTHSSSGGTAAGVAAGPLHSNLGCITGTAAAAAVAAATAGGNSLASSVHMGLLLSPATRLSLGGASTVDEAAWSSGRPSLGRNAGDVGEAGRLSVGPPLAAAAPAVTGTVSRGPGGIQTTAEGLGGVSGAGSLGVGAAAGHRQQPVVMASWSSMSSNASGNLPRVPRLSLPPTLHVPDAPVPGSGNRSGASSSRIPDAGTAASLVEQQGQQQQQQQQQQKQQQGSSGVPAQLPPPPPELLAHLRKSQQLQSQQGQQSEQVSTFSGAAASQVDRTATAGSSAGAGSRQGIGSCKFSSGGAASDRDRLVSKVLNTGLTEFSFEEEEGEDESDDPHDSRQECVRQQDGDDGSGSEFGGD